MRKSAVFSKDRIYRYALLREWEVGDHALFIGLNPSTADEELDDPTIRRCIQFAKNWGCCGLWMVNLFAYRSTDPNELLSIDDPIGPDNDWHIKLGALTAGRIIAAWGVRGNLKERDQEVSQMLRKDWRKIECLGITKEGFPRHPLYLSYDVDLMPYKKPGVAGKNNV